MASALLLPGTLTPRPSVPPGRFRNEISAMHSHRAFPVAALGALLLACPRRARPPFLWWAPRATWRRWRASGTAPIPVRPRDGVAAFPSRAGRGLDSQTGEWEMTRP